MEHIVLLPSMGAVLAWRKKTADCGDFASFSTTCATPRAWQADLWDAYGDSRRIASPVQRSLALLRALGSSDSGILASGGTLKLAERLVEYGLGSAELDTALAGEWAADALPSGAEALLSCVKKYEEILASAGLVDSGRAWEVLSCSQILDAHSEVELHAVEVSSALGRFLESQGASVQCDDASDRRIERVSPGVDVRFAFPSGRYAEPALLANHISELSADETVAIATPDSLSAYGQIAPRLMQSGRAVACRARTPFLQTDFGRAYCCVSKLVTSETLDVCAAADFALNPFSRMSKRSAYDFAARVRGDRLIDKDACFSLLREESRNFEYFEDLVESPEAVALAGVFEDCARGIGVNDDSYVHEQLSAIGLVRDLYAAACSLGASVEECRVVLESARVDSSRQSKAGAVQVEILPQARLADCDAGSYDHVILLDMTSSAYPLKEEHDAAVELLEALGVGLGERALPRARRLFSGCVAAARKGIVIERSLNDENASPTYPAAVVQEFVDCYREDPTNLDDIDNPYSLPDALQRGMLQRGEESLFENASATGQPQKTEGRIEKPGMQRVTAAYQSKLMLPRLGKHGALVEEPCFSASQIESYLECPQKWFALRRLRLDELDEGFGAKEMGDFSHNVFEDFYTRFQERVSPKVLPENLETARGLMAEVLAEHEAAQPSLKPLSNRLVAMSELERREVADLKRKLLDYLDQEARLLQDFHPAYFEYEIPAASPVPYAGRLLMGKIDRIDVDDRGRAIIIDYKSSLSHEYDLYEGEKQGGAMRHGKVQTLIYAQAVRRLLGLEVVGALYVCYGRSQAVSGALDKSIETLHVPGLRSDLCTYKGELGPEFADLLDAIEARVAEALDRLLAGEVPARPQSASACSFCPEITCSQRKG